VGSIEIRREIPQPEPDYGAKTFDEQQRAGQRHRDLVGGLWEEMGQLQRDFLVEQGLTPDMQFLDVGCGALRAGRLLVDHLEPGHYYGIDIGADVLQIGYDEELADAQRARLPEKNLRVTDRFDADFDGLKFDMAIAQSVFTHIPLNSARVCLWRIAKVMKPGGRFFVTFYERPRGTDPDRVFKRKYSDHNVYWNYRSDLRWLAERVPFDFRYIGDWGHPRGQRMVEYTRV
jgi:SAM-dependent methyltransferase